MNKATDNYSSISKSLLIESGEDKYLLSEPVSKDEMYCLMLDLLEK